MHPLFTTPLSSPSNTLAKPKAAVQFGNAMTLPGWVGVVDPALRAIQRTRFQEMMIEDVFGFALPRTGIDLSRQYLFKNTYNNKRELNVISGRERLMMEVMGFLQCWVGLIGGFGGALLARKTGGLSREFMSYNSMGYWQGKLGQAGARNREDGLRLLAQDIRKATPNSAVTAEMLETMMRPVLLGKEKAAPVGIAIAKALGQEHLDVVIGQGRHQVTHNIPTLLEETRLYFNSLGRPQNGRPNVQWTQTGLNRLGQLNRLKAWTIPTAVAAGFAYNFLSPTIIHKLTKKIDRLEDYPGEMGLRELKKIEEKIADGERHPLRSKRSEWFPFLSKSLREGNVVPLLINMIPLPFALGFFETQKLAQQGFKKAWTAPFSKGFAQRFLKLYDFSKVFPYTTSQQISSIYAALILSRMVTARDDVEFRERTIDAFLGWTIWMLANPWLKQKFAQLSDKTGKTKLLKTVGNNSTMKTRDEIINLIKNPGLKKRTLTNFVKINFLALMGTILLLGIVEPYVAIKLTEWQTRKRREHP